MSKILLFDTIPLCTHAIYAFYIALFLVSLVILAIATDIFEDKNKIIKKKLLRLIKRKQCERTEDFGKLKEKLDFEFTREGMGLSKDEEQINKEVAEIVELSFDELAGKLKSGQLSAVKALRAFQYKTLQETNKFNCVTEFIHNAEDLAIELDKKWKSKSLADSSVNSNSFGPLHGIPVCIKDDHDIKGMDTTLGLTQNLYKPAEKNAVMVQTLIDLGAVPFCKTNLPQVVVCFGSYNPIFGETKNSLNPMLSPSGSSSGTASLIAAGGALFGTGTDIGGSLRYPANNCGISGLRPTFGRLSAKGIKKSYPAVGVTPIVPGILAKDSHIISKVFRHIVENEKQHKEDCVCPPMTWNSEIFNSKKKLRIGYITSLPTNPTIGDTPGTILKAAAALESAGHTVIPFEMPDAYELRDTIISLINTGEVHLKKLLQNEPEIFPDLVDAWVYLKMSKWTQRLLGFLLSIPWFPQHSKRISSALQAKRIETVSDLWEICEKKEQFQNEILDKMAKEQLDAILSPVSVFSAVTPEQNSKLTTLAQYLFMWSYLDFPTGVTRFGTETGNLISSYNDKGDSLLKLFKKAAESSIGMPIGIQITGKPFEEETVLRIMCILDTLYSASKTDDLT